MNTLIIDTTYESCSASIVDSDMHCHYSFNDSNKLQSETITEVVFDTLDKAAIIKSSFEGMFSLLFI